MNYLIIIVLVQIALFVLLFSKAIQEKLVFISNGILFFILFGVPLFFAIFEPEFYDGFKLTFLAIWLVSLSIVNILLPILISYVSVGLHKSIFYEKTNSKH